MNDKPNPLGNLMTETYAIMSTVHMTREDSDRLDQLDNTVQDMPDGILYVEQMADEQVIRVKLESEEINTLESLREYGFSAPFAKLIAEGIQDERICGFLFDAAGPDYDHLPSFTW